MTETDAPSRTPLLPLVGLLFRRAFWLPVAFLGLHATMLAGWWEFEGPVPYDVVMHFAGGVIAAWSWRRVLDVLVEEGWMGEPEKAVRAVLVFALTGTAVVLWELFEWFTDHFLATRFQGSLFDTNLDMALGLLGGLLYLLVGTVRRRAVPPGPPRRPGGGG